jgi:hypothetical protein
LPSSKIISRGKSTEGGLSLLFSPFRFVLPTPGRAAVIPGLVFFHLVNHAGVRHGHGAVLDPDLVAVSVIAVMVRVEGEPDRFVGQRANLRDDFARARRIVPVYHQYVIFKNDPAVVAMADQDVPLVEIDSVGDLINLANFDCRGGGRRRFRVGYGFGFGFGCCGAEQRGAAKQHFTSGDTTHC